MQSVDEIPLESSIYSFKNIYNQRGGEGISDAPKLQDPLSVWQHSLCAIGSHVKINAWWPRGLSLVLSIKVNFMEAWQEVISQRRHPSQVCTSCICRLLFLCSSQSSLQHGKEDASYSLWFLKLCPKLSFVLAGVNNCVS